MKKIFLILINNLSFIFVFSGLASFVFAGFLFNQILGCVVLGLALIGLAYIISPIGGDK
ncbi:hypothetical protein LOOC260_114270 [Paucilactobacillus hokkaidonensis JCM 18461]|uniref:DUF1056 family protein n=1 Tax=Paucilactobacillus hokkaidonensis JCM 18461 TaxID=1291742 RepID=A0A0A1GYE0_9LACO|nr:hypothetical protein [Paucilactobacillus hokkaidonensis]BAP85963.1 hypothetical protein LOOC260_114270 [Paucilactobacillus hokkaidonensis JCM 18461]